MSTGCCGSGWVCGNTELLKVIVVSLGWGDQSGLLEEEFSAFQQQPLVPRGDGKCGLSLIMGFPKAVGERGGGQPAGDQRHIVDGVGESVFWEIVSMLSGKNDDFDGVALVANMVP